MEKSLPLLKYFTNNIFSKAELDLRRVTLVCMQHLLDTTVELFKTLINLGFLPKNIFLMGKHYSQSQVAIQNLLGLGIYIHPSTPQLKIGNFSEVFQEDINCFWEHILLELKDISIKTIIILDHGGLSLIKAPDFIFHKYQVIGIEQTTYGTMRAGIASVGCPIIQVALSAAKKELEPPIIATAIVHRIYPLLDEQNNSLRCGIVGAGAVGTAVGRKLITLGYSTTIYDIEKKDIMPTLLKCFGTIEELIQHNDIIFGCTGTDILKQVNLEHVFNGDKIFVSCSSEDKEFLSLLKWIQRDERFTFSANPLLDISYITTKSHKIRILRGGFPINFDNNIEIEPEKDIQLTRTLLLGAIFQALICVKERRFGKYVRYTLHPEIQRYIALKWLTLTHPKNFSQFLEQFSSVEWIICNSQGENFYSPMLKEIFLSEEGRIIAI